MAYFILKKIKPKHIAWLIPLAYLVHLFDEYFSGDGFPNWFSGIFDVSLSITDFVVINSIGLTATVITAILYKQGKVNNFIIATLGILFFINGIIHLIASGLTATYSPGTITGTIIYLPLGFVIFKNVFPLIPEQQRILSVIIGILAQVLIAVVALNI